MMSPLHPELARIAAAYDDLDARCRAGDLDAQSAFEQMARLRCRDDHGRWWRINPQSGRWERLKPDGSWDPATPPTSGVRLDSPLALSGHAGAFVPDAMVDFAEVERTHTEPIVAVMDDLHRHRRPRARLTWTRPPAVVLCVAAAAVLVLTL